MWIYLQISNNIELMGVCGYTVRRLKGMFCGLASGWEGGRNVTSYRYHVCRKRLEWVGGLIRGQLQLLTRGLGLINKQWQQSCLHLLCIYCPLIQLATQLTYYEPGCALRGTWCWGSRFFRTVGTWTWYFFSPTHRPYLPLVPICVKSLSRPLRHTAAESFKPMKISKHP